MNLADLKKPFPPDRISWRVGSTTKDKTKGMALAYIDARDVQDRLDDVCGVAGWQNRYPHANGKTVCEVGIRLFPHGAPELDAQGLWSKPQPYEWIWKADGAGDSDVEAEKGALSDAFKRAAVKWGVGRYLYDLDSPWVELETYEKNGQTFVKGIKQGEYAKLRKLLEGKGAADNDIPDGVRNWVEQQKEVISCAKMLPDLTSWLDTNGGDLLKPALSSNLDRLLKKNKPAFIDLKNHYLTQMAKI